MWTEVSSSVPHFLHLGSFPIPIMHRYLLKVLCPVSRPITTLVWVLLRDNSQAPVAGSGPEINSRACLCVLQVPRHNVASPASGSTLQQHFWAPVSSGCYCSVCTCLQITRVTNGLHSVVYSGWPNESFFTVNASGCSDWSRFVLKTLLQASQLMVFHQWRIRVRWHDSQTFMLRTDQNSDLLLRCLF